MITVQFEPRAIGIALTSKYTDGTFKVMGSKLNPKETVIEVASPTFKGRDMRELKEEIRLLLKPYIPHDMQVSIVPRVLE